MHLWNVKKNFLCALLVNFRSATHICKNGNCTSVSGTPEVRWTFGAEFLQASSLIGPVLYHDYSIGYIFPVSQICLHLRCALLQFNFLHAFTSCEKTLKIKNSYCSNGGTEILNQLLSSSFGLIYMSESLHGTHLWGHCPLRQEMQSPPWLIVSLHFRLKLALWFVAWVGSS